MSHYKPYPKYKDSGVEWLGRVPEHWQISRLGFESWVRARLGWKGLKAEEYVDDGFVFLATPNIKDASIDFEKVNFISEYRYNESPEIKLRIGDILLAKDGSTLGTVNVVRVLPRPATVNSSIAVITPNVTLNEIFLYYLFQSSYIENTIQRIKGGMGVPHLFQEDLNKFYIPLPPIEEQPNIAAHLDRETTRIDALIAKKTRFIELLREKRQALITHAVTKGLDPNVKMKDSGVEWLGEVPEHWMTMSLARVAISRCDGPFGSSIKSEHYVDKGVRVVRLQNIGLGFFKDDDKAFLDIDYCRKELGGGHNVIAGDLLMGGLGDENNPLGRACIAPELIGPAIVKADCYRFRLDTKKVIPIFIGLQLSATARVECGFISTGATRERLNLGLAAGRVIAIPPTLHEQTKIVRYVKDWQGRIDKIVLKTNRSIDLLKERRAALITAAVTGQIDVRETA